MLPLCYGTENIMVKGAGNTYPFVGKWYIKSEEKDGKEWTTNSPKHCWGDLDDDVTEDGGKI